jgi:hypothetical protein
MKRRASVTRVLNLIKKVAELKLTRGKSSKVDAREEYEENRNGPQGVEFGMKVAEFKMTRGKRRRLTCRAQRRG